MKNIISFLMLLIVGILQAQTVQVNPDGTHTIIHQTDNNTSVQVNHEGTHTVIPGNVKVNPDGTHTVIHEGEETSVQVNPDGTHTVIHNNETNAVQVNLDRTHTNLPKQKQEKRSKRKDKK
ncbi:P pilus assembly chaperone PapD [Flavobacterium arsenatis]|uniref:P pilus assembly chaperone PapD n=1 Tax=Flavobacterium arsenatis TaxID=1484332 RepID=A0ABU1TQE4_9FLAO|nr:hypothetical protein [Flavobacterium arsenatis]MDR6967628.1 P pilus assembly chaperone PapD [Flavobacterium arsenatis]